MEGFQKIPGRNYYRRYHNGEQQYIKVINNCNGGNCKTRYKAYSDSLTPRDFYDTLDAIDYLTNI